MARQQDAASLITARNRVARGVPPLTEVIRGTLLRHTLTCGNPDCRCREAKRNRHGPYCYVAVSYGKGRQRCFLLPAGSVARAKKGIEAYGKLWDSLCRISELNLDLLRLKR